MSQKSAAAKKFGSQAVADMLNHVDDDTRKRLLKALAEKDPDAHSRVQDELFTFEDIAKLEDVDVRAILAKATPMKLALAMRKVSPELKAKILGYLSKLAAEQLLATFDEIGPQRLSLVEAAQREIIDLAKPYRL